MSLAENDWRAKAERAAVIHVVTGHICSGKTTWVMQNAKPGDVVIDFDRLADAMSPDGTLSHDPSDAVREVVRVARWAAIDEAYRQHNKNNVADVWIVHAYPTEKDRARYAMLDAAVKVMEAPDDVLIRRAKAERPERMQRSLMAALTGGGC
jgi:hypothetical protein